VKLDIGCGKYRHEGYTGVDAYVETDIKADMWKVPLEDESVEEIFSRHALEHVPMAKVNETLKEWYRLLVPGGKVVLLVPNMDYIARFWLTHKPDEHGWAEAILFGNQEHEGEYHKSAFTPLGLQGDLQNAGFIVDSVEILWDADQETIRANARKPNVPA